MLKGSLMEAARLGGERPRKRESTLYLKHLNTAGTQKQPDDVGCAVLAGLSTCMRIDQLFTVAP